MDEKGLNIDQVIQDCREKYPNKYIVEFCKKIESKQVEKRGIL